ncbi:hypothetical protein ASC77_09390 [Nocardioides sp. Root1257]|uniref:hypothetical protein n=1 Tax=unclassified Nocardioides TaxID=2615069 RepID=UPI0006FB87D9|nr:MULTISPECIES: hypothetical protein [unclassified Nocardioides]KQW48922.1 hypothetical protein ASC77_09390 [Nocardioides sp. Root1257]KRC48097.1 hypothetical protein ASE24_09395 [Nocardioides sp. Root224]
MRLTGTHPDVSGRASAALRSFLAGGDWPEPEVEPDPTLVLLDRVAGLELEVVLRAYLPLQLLVAAVVREEVDAEREQAAVDASLRTPLGLVGLLSPPNQMLVYPPGRAAQVVAAAARFHDELAAWGPVFTVGHAHGEDLWSLPTNLAYAEAHTGG